MSRGREKVKICFKTRRVNAENVRINLGLQCFFIRVSFLHLIPVLSLLTVNKINTYLYCIEGIVNYTTVWYSVFSIQCSWEPVVEVEESETLLLLCRRCVRDVDRPPAHLQSHQSSAHTNNYISQPETLYSHISHTSQSQTIFATNGVMVLV